MLCTFLGENHPQLRDISLKAMAMQTLKQDHSRTLASLRCQKSMRMGSISATNQAAVNSPITPPSEKNPNFLSGLWPASRPTTFVTMTALQLSPSLSQHRRCSAPTLIPSMLNAVHRWQVTESRWAALQGASWVREREPTPFAQVNSFVWTAYRLQHMRLINRAVEAYFRVGPMPLDPMPSFPLQSSL